METKGVPYRKTVFVCTNARKEGERVSCGKRGGMDLCESLKEAVKAAGLKGKVRVARSGCLDLCEKGPNIFIYPDNVWLSDVQPCDLNAILDKISK